MTVRIYRPDGAVGEQGHRISPPRRVLAGARIGVLDNLKPNAGTLMTYVAGQLAEKDLRWAIVTTPEGQLLGVASREDLDRAAKAP